eukprot:CAMPEP_0113505352 /NCGR_PEP_ID=MMETSP0014_2-20120614/35265_1 /TAXON_ID=2857 /ORGANISM="Nitzschia sp." /LENGTH=455 /DNA_ID=CAMNT_0000400647 /DNA_START=142 /DNA_END=1509 /DNA_ORIENTATION=+ /assembly_acc=CAM_ASM_000159
MFRTAAARAAARATRSSTSTSIHFNKTAASRRAAGVAVAPFQQHQRQAFSSSTTPGSGSDSKLSYDVVPKEDFGQYKEYSVIFTNRALNLMSDPFQKVMRDLNDLLKTTYNADKVAIIPGSGTFGMEAVARQFATDEHVMVIRNGWFSFRWTEIFEMGGIPKSHTVLKAQPQQGEDPVHVQYAPYPVDDVVAKIYEERPKAIFCAHVETSTGMIVPDDYIRKVSAAVHDVGGIFVLDCIASGTVWADMKDLGVDVVISAPQKGWTGPCCAALVMMSERAAELLQTTKETSFSMSLKRWSAIMDTYTAGGFGYHTTMPTDGLRDFHEISVETLKFGLPELKQAQYDLGKTARAALDERGLVSVAAHGYQAPGVLVYYSPSETANPDMMAKFKAGGLQIAMGVPWRIDEPEGLKTFRLGLFGLDKMGDIQGTVATLTAALDPILVDTNHAVPDKKVA